MISRGLSDPLLIVIDSCPGLGRTVSDSEIPNEVVL